MRHAPSDERMSKWVIGVDRPLGCKLRFSCPCQHTSNWQNFYENKQNNLYLHCSKSICWLKPTEKTNMFCQWLQSPFGFIVCFLKILDLINQAKVRTGWLLVSPWASVMFLLVRNTRYALPAAACPSPDASFGRRGGGGGASSPHSPPESGTMSNSWNSYSHLS